MYDGNEISYAFRCRNCGLYDLEPVAKQVLYHECRWAGAVIHKEIELADFPARACKPKKKKK
jgi:hypothetical protein